MLRITTPALVVLTLLSCLPFALVAQEHDQMHEEHAEHGETSQVVSAADLAAIEAVVDAYHTALAKGDRDSVGRLLADEVMILESGGSEDRGHYLEHHLPGDMAFAAAVERVRGDLQIQIIGDVAWVTSTSTTKGTYREREIDSVGAELMVLAREDDGWRIRAIHWSSRPNRGG
jgi:ketosteroid isomerase-like protein